MMCVGMQKLGLRLERKDGRDTLEFDEVNHRYYCEDDEGKRVECISVTTVLGQEIFHPFDADEVITKYFDK